MKIISQLQEVSFKVQSTRKYRRKALLALWSEEERNSFPHYQRSINAFILLSGSEFNLVTVLKFEGNYEDTFYTLSICYIIRPF